MMQFSNFNRLRVNKNYNNRNNHNNNNINNNSSPIYYPYRNIESRKDYESINRGEISISSIKCQNFTHPRYKELEGADANALVSIVLDIEKHPVTRAAAFICLLENYEFFFSNMPYATKFEMLYDFLTEHTFIIVTTGKIESFQDYCIAKYLRIFYNDKDMLRFLHLIQPLVDEKKYAYFNSLSLRYLRGTSKRARRFLRQGVLNGAHEVAAKLARLKREEDVGILTVYFLPNNARIGNSSNPSKIFDLETDTNQERSFFDSSPTPINSLFFGNILDFLPASKIVHVSQVCKKWFNELNDEKLWQRMCIKKNYGKIPRFSWCQSYFLFSQANVIVDANDPTLFWINGPTFSKVQEEIIQNFPHPLFLAILRLHKGYTLQIATILASHAQEIFADYATTAPDAFQACYNIIKQKGLETHLLFWHLTIEHLETIYPTTKVIEVLYSNCRRELIEKLIAIIPCNYFFTIMAIPTFISALVKIMEKEPELCTVWKTKLESCTDAEWLKYEFIPTLTRAFLNESLLVPLIMARLQTTTNTQLIIQAMKIFEPASQVVKKLGETTISDKNLDL